MRLLVLWCCLLTGLVRADELSIRPNQPPFALTLQQLAHWSPDSELADPGNVSRHALASRLPAPLAGQSTKQNPARVLYAPDGMNNFANYLDVQPAFNLYNFTHWPQIDILNWFAGTAEHTVQIPARPWVETAHRNGVKVIGSVFLGVARWGGNPDTVAALLRQDKDGRFVLADKLIQIADYYGFDGWLINQETDLTAVKDAANQLVEEQNDLVRGRELAAAMLQFLQYLTANAPQGMEIHWYDAMVDSGEVRWQNRLNEQNSRYLQEGKVRSSDAVFLNYWWDQAMVEASREQALGLGRSPYEVYTGVDLWPSRNAQRAFSRRQWLDWLFKDGQALTSIALFAPNFNFNFDGESHTPAFSNFDQDPCHAQDFYRTETRLFAGDDLNLAEKDARGWQGLGAYLPARTTLLRLPFVTHFNTGQGKQWVEQGQKQGGPWTQMAWQDPLPTWQFAWTGEGKLELDYDFERVYQGGSALSVQATADTNAVAPLFATDFEPGPDSQLTLTWQGQAQGVSLVLTMLDGQQHVFSLSSASGWKQQNFSLQGLAGQRIRQIGLKVEKAAQARAVQLGRLEISP